MIKHFYQYSLLFVLLFGTLQSKAQKNLQLLSNLPFPNKSCAGVWQYVDKNGKEYALIGTSTDLAIVDISDPKAPKLLHSIPGNKSTWRELKTYNDYAYVVTEGGGGMTIVDLRELPDKAPYKVWKGDGTISGKLGAAHTIAATDRHLYIFGTSGLAGGGAVIASLDDPWNPKYVGQYSSNYIHDGYIRNDTLWAAEINDGIFEVIDVKDKSKPKLLATQETPFKFTHTTWLSDNSKFVFTSDEKPNAPLAAYDISDLTNIKLVDKYLTTYTPSGEVHNIKVIDDFLVNSCYGSQVTIVDAAHPDMLIEVAYYKTGKNMCWDASPYLPSGNIIATDLDNGLYIFKPTYQRACFINGIITDSITGSKLSGVKVEVLNGSTAVSTINTVANGEYKYGQADPASFTVRYTKTGYKTKTITVSLVSGTTTRNIKLIPNNVGIGEEAYSRMVAVYPNPFTSQATVKISNHNGLSDQVSFILKDVLGRTVMEVQGITTPEFIINRKDLINGMYFYQLQSSEGIEAEGKIMIE